MKYSSPVNIVLLHKNLRISDNSALYHGCNADKSLIIYAYDKDYWSNNGKSERQFQFCLDSLGELDEKLNKLNRELFIFEGDLDELALWIDKSFPQSKIFLNQSTDIHYHRNLKAKFISKFEDSGRLYEFEDFGIQTKNHNRDDWSSNWHRIMTQKILPPPQISHSSKIKPKDLLDFKAFKKKLSLVDPKNNSFQLGGEDKAKKLLSSFLEKRMDGYSIKMSSPVEAEHSCSRLSPHISFGTISLRTIFQEVQKSMNLSLIHI